MADKKNVKATQQFMLKGRKVETGEVVAKTDFPNKQDWQNLLHMSKPRVEETDEAVGKPKAAAKGKAAADPAMPGA